MSKQCLHILLGAECLIYLKLERAPSSGPEVRLSSSHSLCCGNHSKINELYSVRQPLRHRFSSGYCIAAVQRRHRAARHHSTVLCSGATLATSATLESRAGLAFREFCGGDGRRSEEEKTPPEVQIVVLAPGSDISN